MTATLIGIDVSKYQADPVTYQPNALLASWLPKVDFVIINATTGKTGRSPSLVTLVAAARKAGKRVGFYHFAWPENGWQADVANFLAAIKDLVQPGDILMLDFEPFQANQPLFQESMTGPYLVGFADAVKAAWKVDPWLYLPEHFGDVVERACTPEQLVRIRQMPFDKAGKNNAYVTSPTLDPGNLHGWAKLTCWQWSETPLDQNVFYGDAAEWDRLAVPQPVAPTPVPPAPVPVTPAPVPVTPTPTPGGTMGSCPQTTWRGSNASSPAVVVCSHSVPRLNRWAGAVGNDILLKALKNCGAYQTSTAASKGTHAGGGAIDLDMNGLSYEQRRRVESRGRQYYGLSYYRPAITGLWTNHNHAIDSTCPNISPAGAAQFPLLGRGLNALADRGPDTGDRTYVGQVMKEFAQRLFNAVTDVAQAVILANKVKSLQAAVRQTTDGVWGDQTDIDLRNTAAEAVRNYSGVYFRSWSVISTKRMQRSWGAAQTGVWDAGTAAAAKATVVQIQKALGVSQDGVWGPVTTAAYWGVRKQAYKGSFPAVIPTPAKPASPTPAPVVPKVDYGYPYQPIAGWYPYPGKQGASYYGPSQTNTPWYSGKQAGGTNTGVPASGGLRLDWIQAHIQRIQRCSGAPIDGRYGALTVAKVKAWQKAHGLTADGIVGPRTWAAMAKSKGQGK